jgi:teichuronic acid biosynthesis glycosyltransferase TuaH
VNAETDRVGGTRPLLVYVAGIEWHGIKGTDRHLVERLAATVDVLWVDPPVSILRTVRRRAGEGPRVRRSLEPVADGITRLGVVVQPFPSRPGSRALSHWWLRRSLEWAVGRMGRPAHAMVTSRPEPVLDALPDAVHVYFATDDFVAGADLLGLSTRRLRWAEAQQVRTADLLVAVTSVLASRWQDTGKPVLVLPNGCDTATYARVDEELPADLTLDGPAAGMIGQISARIDLDLLEATVERGVPLLLVGPVDPTFEPDRFAALVTRSGVHWVGAQPFDRLPSFLALMGVGLTPYADTAFNRASFPLKTMEYLAAGRPVVSAALPAVRELACEHVVATSDPARFAAEAERLLASDMCPEVRAERRAFARRHDWSVRATTLLEAIDRESLRRAAH